MHTYVNITVYLPHSSYMFRCVINHLQGGKIKAFPLQAWSGPEGCRKLRFPDFMTTAQDGGKVVRLMHRSPLPQGNTPGTYITVRG
jgi:hypothetical protein